MDVTKLQAEPRQAGKHSARLARTEGKVPAVLYGGTIPTYPIQVPEKDLSRLVASHEQHRIELAVEGKSYDCILKDVSFDPISLKPRHADFMVLQRGHKITIQVPIRFVGTPVGQIEQGGETTISAHDLQISCLPKDMPAHIDIDISGLHIGESLHVSDLKPGSGIQLLDSPAKSIATVLAPRIEVEAAPEAVTEKVETPSEEKGES